MTEQAKTRDLGRAMDLVKNYGIVVAFLVLVAVLSAISPNHVFATPKNFVNVLKQTAINGILAMGMMFVITSGGIDLSVGSTVAFAGVVAAMFAHPGTYPLIVPILLACLAGLAVGIFNGAAVAFGGIPSFIVTLGSMTMIRGLALITAGGTPVTNVSPEFEQISGLVGSIPCWRSTTSSSSRCAPSSSTRPCSAATSTRWAATRRRRRSPASGCSS